MKLLTLNAWGGKMHEPLLEFIGKMAGDVDIFCLQETFSTPTDLEFQQWRENEFISGHRKDFKGLPGLP